MGWGRLTDRQVLPTGFCAAAYSHILFGTPSAVGAAVRGFTTIPWVSCAGFNCIQTPSQPRAAGGMHSFVLSKSDATLTRLWERIWKLNRGGVGAAQHMFNGRERCRQHRAALKGLHTSLTGVALTYTGPARPIWCMMVGSNWADVRALK